MTTERTTYEVVARGTIQSTHRTESAAVEAARRFLESDEPAVQMIVRSGTYMSRTVVWPVVGNTVSV